jgi:hypothetical protein
VLDVCLDFRFVFVSELSEETFKNPLLSNSLENRLVLKIFEIEKEKLKNN